MERAVSARWPSEAAIPVSLEGIGLSDVRKARPVDESLGQTGPAEGGIVGPEAESLVIASDGDDPTI